MKKIRNKHGFTIVELVIVIAVIAILAAVLIPTFSSVIRSANSTSDRSTVSSMNKALFIGCPVPGAASYEQAKGYIADAGITLPINPKQSGFGYYWIPSENKVVLCDENSGEVDYPDEYRSEVKNSAWVRLSDSPVTTDAVTDNTEETTADTDTEPSGGTLLSGKAFSDAVEQLCVELENVTGIIFGKTSDYPDKTSLPNAPAAAEGEILMYYGNGELYVLSDGQIFANSDFGDAFSGMTDLKTVSFNNFDTSETVKMNRMFAGCSSLVTLDLSSFNTSKVTETASMFDGCRALDSIFVKKSANGWNVGKVTSSSNMFRDCDKLIEKIPEPTIIDLLLAWLGGKVEDLYPADYDVKFANTDGKGFLTEK